jgi:hypothetical protein
VGKSTWLFNRLDRLASRDLAQNGDFIAGGPVEFGAYLNGTFPAPDSPDNSFVFQRLQMFLNR